MIMGKLVVLRGFRPFLALCGVVTQVLVHLLQHLVVAGSLLNQLDYSGPVSETHS